MPRETRETRLFTY